MDNVGSRRSAKHTDDFKRLLVAKSMANGVSVPMVSKRHGVPSNRIYAWRGDARFQTEGLEAGAFTPVEVADVEVEQVQMAPNHAGSSQRATTPEPKIEITLENGRKLVVSDGVDAGFVLELARGLAA